MSNDPRPSVPAPPATPATAAATAVPDDMEPAALRYGKLQRALFAFVGLMGLFMAAILGIGGSWLMAVAMVVFGGVMGYFAVTGREPLIPLAGVQMARKFMFFDPSTAVSELGLPLTPVRGSLERAVEWFRSHGYAK